MLQPNGVPACFTSLLSTRRRSGRHSCGRPARLQKTWRATAGISPLYSATSLGEHIRNLPPFLPAEQVRNAFGAAGLAIALVSVTNLVLKRGVSATTSIQNESRSRKKHTKIVSLQGTYLVVNAAFALWGIAALLPMIHHGVWNGASSALSRAEGHVALGAFGSMQAGYSLWSIAADRRNKYVLPRDGKAMDEGTIMLIHHGVIVLAGMLLATCSLGFRAYAPFFCGVAELSSVPLVVMKALAKGRRKGYQASRLAFAAMFFSIRIIAWLVFVWLLLRDFVAMLLLCGRNMGKAMLIPLSETLPLLVLTALQLRWAVVIINSVTKAKRKPASQS